MVVAGLDPTSSVWEIPVLRISGSSICVKCTYNDRRDVLREQIKEAWGIAEQFQILVLEPRSLTA